MSDDPIAIARVGLARSLPRMLGLPALLVLLGIGAVIGAVVVGGATGLGIGIVGDLLVLVGIGLALLPLTLRVEVEVGGLRVRWLFGGRRYRLVPGAVTRATMEGTGGRVIRTRWPILGWAYGRAMLRGDEPIWIVRLAATPSVILIPTDRGRLAVAAASETELLEALGAAARVQQRLDEVSGRVLAALPAPTVEHESVAALPAAAPPSGEAAPPRILTGIERARLEADLAAARAAALEAAQAERQALEEARASGGAATAAGGGAGVAPSDVWVVEEEPPLTAPSLARQRIRGAWTRPDWATDSRLRAMSAVAWALVPLAASGAAYLVAGGGAALDAVDIGSRLRALALLTCGPAAALAVLAARAWWPRLAGLVTVTAIGALVLMARAGIG